MITDSEEVDLIDKFKEIQGTYETLKLRLKQAKEKHNQLTMQVREQETEQDNSSSSEVQQYRAEYGQLQALIEEKQGELASYGIKKGSGFSSCFVSNF